MQLKLFVQFCEKSKDFNASSLRTLAHSIDLLADLCAKGAVGKIEHGGSSVLIVDDDLVTRRAITYGLDKAGLKSTAVEDAEAALSVAAQRTFDLIFMDILMPGMDGFALCKKVRSLPSNKRTPVIFITTLTDFKSRAQASLSGGIDYIAKPFMFMELTVKALLCILRTPKPAK